MRYYLITMKAWSYSIFQSVGLASFRVVKNDFNLFVKQEMNRRRVANQPVSCCTPFLEVRIRDSIIALSCIGLASIPLCVTIKPKNLLELTPNAHFRGLSFISFVHSNSKVSCMCFVLCMIGVFFGFDKHIVDINFHGLSHQWLKYLCH